MYKTWRYHSEIQQCKDRHCLLGPELKTFRSLSIWSYYTVPKIDNVEAHKDYLVSILNSFN